MQNWPTSSAANTTFVFSFLLKLQTQKLTLLLQSMGRLQQDLHKTGPSTVHFVALPQPPNYEKNTMNSF